MGWVKASSWKQRLVQRVSSEAENLNLLLAQATLATSSPSNFLRIMLMAKSPTDSNPIFLLSQLHSLNNQPNLFITITFKAKLFDREQTIHIISLL